jgi:NAD(P)-dependent dehydrogenase (short-subunit alcohol dehydrogenase family)
MQQRVCVVVGFGPGNGSSLATRFAKEGYRVALLSRDDGKLQEGEKKIPGSKGFPCDIANPTSGRAAFAKVRAEFGAVDTLVFNAGSGVWGSLDEIDDKALSDSLAVNAVGLLVAAKQVVPDMVKAGAGTIAVIGAGAAWRGRPKTLAFAAAKAAQRSIAQSLARDFGPKGIHVFYVVIDGVVDLPRTRNMMQDKPDDFFLKPDAIALSVWNTAQQPKSAWTFELDVRPFSESW